MPVSIEKTEHTYTKEEVVIRLSRAEAAKLQRLLSQAVTPSALLAVGLGHVRRELIELLKPDGEDTRLYIWGQWTNPATFDHEWPHK